MQAFHCSGFSCYRKQALGRRLQQLQHMRSVVAARGLQSPGSVVTVRGLNCPSACGIFLDQGSNPCPLHWQMDSFPLGCQGSPKLTEFNLKLMLQVMLHKRAEIQTCLTPHPAPFSLYHSVPHPQIPGRHNPARITH